MLVGLWRSSIRRCRPRFDPVELREYLGQWVPYVNIRYDLWARVNRSLFFQWVDMALEHQEGTGDGSGGLCLSSNGYSFEVAR